MQGMMFMMQPGDNEETKKRKQEEVDNVNRALAEGDVAVVEEFFRNHKGHSHVVQEKTKIASHMIMYPDYFKNSLALFEVATATDYSFDHLFENRQIEESDLWTMPVRAATPDIVKVAARLLAEYIRREIALKDDYKFNPDKLIATYTYADGLSGEAKKTEVKNTILAVQNALVDYVAEEGDNLMPTRGAAFLKIMGEDLPKGIHQLTTQKITGFHAKRLESLRGETFKTAPVFELNI